MSVNAAFSHPIYSVGWRNDFGIDCCSLALSCWVSVHLETGGVDIDLQRNGSLATVNGVFPKGFFKVFKSA